MDKAQRKNVISGVKLASTVLSLTHLWFADNCIIFSDIKEEEVYQLIQILNTSTTVSRQVINLKK
ncbi:hypothetical protein AHAS_Ahas04G0175200 [Arachis hypogaea]